MFELHNISITFVLCPPRSRPLAYNVRAAWRSGGLNYHFCGLLPFNFAQPFLRGYCRRCAKQPVVRSAFRYLFLVNKYKRSLRMFTSISEVSCHTIFPKFSNRYVFCIYFPASNIHIVARYVN